MAVLNSTMAIHTWRAEHPNDHLILRGADLRGANLRGAALGNNRILQIGPIGSRRDYLILKAGPELDEVSTGCFTGTLAEFEQAINKTHSDSRWGEEYRLAIAMFKATLALEARPQAR